MDIKLAVVELCASRGGGWGRPQAPPPGLQHCQWCRGLRRRRGCRGIREVLHHLADRWVASCAAETAWLLRRLTS